MRSVAWLVLLALPSLASTLRVVAGGPRLCRISPPRALVLAADDADPNPASEIADATDKMKKTIASVQDKLATIRVGRATPSLLDRVEVEYYGAPTPLNQLASITVATATQLVVDPYDKYCLFLC